MPETLVVCGGVRRRPHRDQDVLRLDVNAKPGDPARVNLNIDHLSRRMVENLPAWLTDLLEIACYVYCADQFTRRDTPQMQRLGQRWRRSSHFVVPVREIGVWRMRSVNDALVSALSVPLRGRIPI